MSGGAQAAAERGHVYAMLSSVFRRPLDERRLEILRAPDMLAAMQAAGIDPGEDFATAETADLLDRLAIEYTRLFHGPGDHISLYEGMLADGDDSLRGKACDEVRSFMADIGFSVPPETGELPDHVSVELAFLAELCKREADALASGDGSAAEFARCMESKFLSAHPGRWARRFADRVRRRAELPFYASMAEFLHDFVGDDEKRRAA